MAHSPLFHKRQRLALSERNAIFCWIPRIYVLPNMWIVCYRCFELKLLAVNGFQCKWNKFWNIFIKSFFLFHQLKWYHVIFRVGWNGFASVWFFNSFIPLIRRFLVYLSLIMMQNLKWIRSPTVSTHLKKYIYSNYYASKKDRI